MTAQPHPAREDEVTEQTLFDADGGPVPGAYKMIEPPKKLSYTALLTIKREALLVRGFNPATRQAIREPRDKTCGDCTHHVVREYAKTYHKCAMAGDSASEATDIRVGWPACVLFREIVR